MTVLRAGLIGAHIGRSRFSAALGLLCEIHGLRLEFEPIDIAGRPDFDFAATVDTCRAAGWTGVSVTHPCKADAARYAGDAMTGELRRLGALNTLVFSPRLSVANTDYSGFLDAWRGVFGDRKPGRVALAGAGGVACAIAPALARLGASDIAIWDPAAGLAADLAKRIGPLARALPVAGAATAISAADGLVNATPMGMAQNPGSAFALGLIGGQTWAFDAIYTPVNTAFLRRAHAGGLAILSGFDLFRYMALRSFAAYTGLRPEPYTALAALEHLKPQEEPA